MIVHNRERLEVKMKLNCCMNLVHWQSWRAN